MSKRRLVSNRDQGFDAMSVAMGEMHAYCAARPHSPSAMRGPRLLRRNQLWIALLGQSIEHGIVGIGPNVEAALRAFDSQYLSFAQRQD